MLLWVFRVSEALFQKGWLVESLATEALALFVIRTAGNLLGSRPSPLVAITVLVVLIGKRQLMRSLLAIGPAPPAMGCLTSGS